jgi:hypothetical protein
VPEIHAVTREPGIAAIELLVRFFREENFATPPWRIAENLDRMLADASSWCALAVHEGRAGLITVSTALYIEWGRLGEIGDLYVLPATPWSMCRRIVAYLAAPHFSSAAIR